MRLSAVDGVLQACGNVTQDGGRQILEEHRKNCERQGKYVEAEIAKNRLEELRQHEENR